MDKKMTCIECPRGCVLSVVVEGDAVVEVTGNGCPKGVPYAAAEVKNPTRILTATVLSQGLSLKMVPVRTDRPIPKALLSQAMEEVKKIKINKPVHIGDVVIKNFLGLETNLIATRESS